MCERYLLVHLKRNSQIDHTKDNIKYSGFHMCWPDGQPIDVGFTHFCKIGLRAIFGKTALEDCCVKLIFKPITSRDENLPRLVKRFYIKKSNEVATIYLTSGDSTVISFSAKDDPNVLNWIGWDSLAEEKEQWFDFTSVKMPF